MKIKIDFDNPKITDEHIKHLTTFDLDDFYVGSSEINQLNLFFVLEATYHDLLSREEYELGAHTAFLLAYYLFVPLTPPAAYELACYYIRMAIQLKPTKEYIEWEERILEGH